MSFDAKANFSYALIAVAPVPAASGTTFNVTAGLGAIFPAAPFNVVVWPAGANPLTTNAEVVRITSKGTGDNWTGTRTQESSSARSIAVGDQICLAVTAKTLTDVESAVTTAIAGLSPGGRLTLTTALGVTTADVTGASAVTIFYTPHVHNQVPLYDGSSAWVRRTFTELSIAVPATTSQMYDVFVFDNAGVATLELLAWTNDTTRATALVKQDGRWVKTGATTRLYLGSFRTGTVSGQTEDSFTKRYVWNYYNRVRRVVRRQESTASWTYTVATFRQANASTSNQVDVVIGVAEVPIELEVTSVFSNTSAGVAVAVGVGEDSTTVASVTLQNQGYSQSQVINIPSPTRATFRTYPAVGRHFYAWLEASTATGTTTWFASASGITGGNLGGIYGSIEG